VPTRLPAKATTVKGYRDPASSLPRALHAWSLHLALSFPAPLLPAVQPDRDRSERRHQGRQEEQRLDLAGDWVARHQARLRVHQITDRADLHESLQPGGHVPQGHEDVAG
jgi:hypothetical protein